MPLVQDTTSPSVDMPTSSLETSLHLEVSRRQKEEVPFLHLENWIVLQDQGKQVMDNMLATAH